jgi:hypothetical protein
MFNFINEHFRYDTMNSWNRLKSIANNVKLYNLGLDEDWGTALDFMCDENDCGGLQSEISYMIREWEKFHPGYTLGFNGRSDGYLVMYNKEKDNRVNFRSVLPEWLEGFDDYEEWKEYALEYIVYNIKDLIPSLREYTELIRSFDKLCDDIRDLVNEYSKMDFEAQKKAYDAELEGI